MDNQIQIQLKLITGETENITVENEEMREKIVQQMADGKWVDCYYEGKSKHINGKYVVKIITKSIGIGREVIRKNG